MYQELEMWKMWIAKQKVTNVNKVTVVNNEVSSNTK